MLSFPLSPTTPLITKHAFTQFPHVPIHRCYGCKFNETRADSRASSPQHKPIRETTARLLHGDDDEKKGVRLLPEGLRPDLLPRHVAVIMDGNRRWASLRELPSSSGYQAGVRTLRGMVELCVKFGIRVLTVFAFSIDNWIRPQMEVEFLMNLFDDGVKEEMDVFSRKNIRVSFIGDLSRLPKDVQESIFYAEEKTKMNTRFQLIVAVSYSGHYDLVQACQKIATKVKDGLIEPNDINNSTIEEELETNCTEFQHPDLLIRTSGELRVSNFLLWQLAYTELFFSSLLWPDFGEAEFLEALISFQHRKRRFGE